MKIFDAFMFFNELDLLEIRLEELHNDVDFFVISECTKTHQNNDKPLFFLENKDRFKKFLPKIIHHIFEPEIFPYPWYIENEQRNQLKKAGFEINDGDLFMLSDGDEIVSSDLVKLLKNNSDKIKTPCTCLMQMSYYYINAVIQEPWHHKNWKGTIVLPYKYYNQEPLNYWRSIKDSLPVIEKAGWHFSFIGGIEKVKTKIESYAHSEFNNLNYNSIDVIQKRVSSLQDPLGRSEFKIIKENNLSKFPSSSLKFKNLFI